jgi:hypothetical protein
MKNKGQKNQMISNQNMQHDIRKISTKVILYCGMSSKQTCPEGVTRLQSFEILCVLISGVHLKILKILAILMQPAWLITKHTIREEVVNPPNFRHMGFK